MATSPNASVEFEAGRNLVAAHALTDAGDHVNFSSASKPWSKASGFEPLVTPNGIVTGGIVVPAAAGGNNNVDISAISCYLAGTLTAVGAATNQAITRGATNVAKISSITVTSAGAIAVVAGTDSASTAFSETRGAAGGPPFIPVGSIEIAQVRLASNVAAPIAAGEIFAIVGIHQERYDFPGWQVLGLDGKIQFDSSLPLIHTGSVAKQVYAKVYTPIFTQVPRALDFQPAETSATTVSTDFYGGVIGGAGAASLSQAQFTALLNDGHTDSLLGQKNNNIIIRFKQDRNKAPYSLTQGILNVTRTYPKADQVQATCTLSAEQATQDFAS